MVFNKKKGIKQTPDISREDWNLKEVVSQASNKPNDETVREVLRGDATKGDADERDIVGSVDTNETAQGREEAKKDRKGKANNNG